MPPVPRPVRPSRTQMMTRTTLALTLCAGMLSTATASAGVTVTLKPHATPAGPVVRVGDVADVTADGPGDVPAAARLRAFPLTPGPASGRTAILTAAVIRDRATAGGFAVRLAGAETVTLTGGANEPTKVRRERPASPGDRAFGKKFVTAAVSRALARQGAGAFRIEVALAPDAARTLARQRPDGCDLTGLTPMPHLAQTVTLRWLDRRDQVVTVAAAVRLAPPRLVPVLTEPVPRGAPVTADQVAWRPENDPHTPATAAAPVKPVALASGNRPAAVSSSPSPQFAAPLPRGEAVRDLPAGAVLEADDLRQTPLVRANQTVRVESRIGGVTVSRDLKATRNGLLGQTIPLADPDGPSYGGRNRIFARVVGNRRAVLVGEGAASEPYAAVGRVGNAGGSR